MPADGHRTGNFWVSRYALAKQQDHLVREHLTRGAITLATLKLTTETASAMLFGGM